ncbi:MAG: hypothetical protein ACHQEB_02340 [Chitinophagales bacterium]
MKKTFSTLILLIGMIAVFSCKSSSDNFVGKWVDCNDPTDKFTITKQGDKYTLNGVDRHGPYGEVYEKKGDYLLSGVGEGQGHNIRYDKVTTHLTQSLGENTAEFCKTSN